MTPDSDLKAVCSVTELTRKLSMSRARFYQLLEMGVFPKPVYCARTKRPFYTLDLQQKCMDIRKTGIGHNSLPFIFNTPRKNTYRRCHNQLDRKYEKLTDILKQMGLNITCNKVKNAVKTLYPVKLTQQPVEGIVIRDLFRYFNQGV